jgi:3'-5' exonuclease
METTIFLDIETIPAQAQSVRDAIAAKVTHPASMSKPETIAKWEAESKPQAVLEAIGKTSFDPAFGHICTIAWAGEDGQPDCAHAETVDQEADVLRALFNAFHQHTRVQFVGHYVGGFDLRFILCRAVVLGVKIPQCIPRDPKPWDGKIFDTMTAWAGAKGTISMDNLCRALGIEGKGDFDGSQVAQAWADGLHQQIADYCCDDVIRTRDIWRKFQAAGW